MCSLKLKICLKDLKQCSAFFPPGNQANVWQRVDLAIDVKQNVSLAVGFEAVRGSSFESDIAIDDITVSLQGPNSGNVIHVRSRDLFQYY